jgi:hypothetical protein
MTPTKVLTAAAVFTAGTVLGAAVVVAVGWWASGPSRNVEVKR